jgi:phosphoglycerate dehydrogenase-like enzyme
MGDMAGPKFCIYVDFSFSDGTRELIRRETSGHELIFTTGVAASVLASSGIHPEIVHADIAVGQPTPAEIAQAPGLRWVHVTSAGITRYDTAGFRAQAAARELRVSNSSAVYARPCAEHVLSFMLAQSRNLPEILSQRLKNNVPEWWAVRSRMVSLEGQTVLIAGYGAIARKLSELLAPFHCRIVAYRRSPRGDEGVPTVSASGLPAALASADHVVNILPASAETDHFFNADQFGAMKRGAVFYNIGRGTTVDQDALLGALRASHLDAAWLDVTEPEPLPDDHPLRKEPRCFITSHVAGGQQNEEEAVARHFLDNLRKFEKGEALVDRVM